MHRPEEREVSGVSLRHGRKAQLEVGGNYRAAFTAIYNSPVTDRYTQRNVKRWQDGDMRKRWTAAGMLVAEQQFRRIIGYRDLANLVIAIERHVLIAARGTSSAKRWSSPFP